MRWSLVGREALRRHDADRAAVGTAEDEQQRDVPTYVVREGVHEGEFVQMRTARDATPTASLLLLPSR